MDTWKELTGAAKERKQKEEQKKKQRTDTWNDLRREAISREVDDKYIQSYLTDSQNYFTQAQNDYAGLSWKTGSDKATNDKRKATADDLQSRSRKIRAYYNLNKDVLGADAYNGMMEYLDSTDGMYSGTLDSFNTAYDFYSQWDSEDLYMRDNAFYEKYGKLSQNEDYGTASANREVGSPDALEYIRYSVNYGGGTYYDPETKELVQLNPTYRKQENYNPGQITDKLGFYLQYKSLPAPSLQTKNDEYVGVLTEGNGAGWDQMTDEQIADYYYLYNTQGQTAAYQYLDDIAFVLRRDRWNAERAATIAEYENATNGEKVWMSAKSIPAQFAANVTANLERTRQAVTGDEWKPYTGMQYAGNVRSATAAELDAKTGNIKIPVVDFSVGDAYQALMSGADSGFNALMSGGVAIGKLGGKTARALGSLITSSTMGGSAYFTEAQRLYEIGASQEQIVQGATAAATIETLTEMLPLDNLFKAKDSKTILKFFKNAAKQAGIEGLEEMLSGIGNTAANHLIMKDDSDWSRLVEQTGSKRGAVVEVLRQAANDFLGGALSGALGGNLGAIGPTVSYGINQRVVGSEIQQRGLTSALADLAHERIANADPKTAKQLQRLVDWAGKKTTSNNVGKLYNAMSAAEQTQVQKAAGDRLLEAGIAKKDAKILAEAMVRQANGEMLTDEQSEVLDKYANNATAQKVLDSVWEQKVSIDQQMVNHKISQTVQTIRQQLEEQGVTPEAAAQLAEMAAQGTASQQVVNIQEESAAAPVTVKQDELQSAEGQVLYEDSPVQVEKIKSAGNGQLIVQLADGASVDASKLSFPNQGEQELYRIVGKISDSAGTANLLLAGLKEGNASAGIYARAIEQAFFYGRHQIPLQQLLDESPFARALTEQQLNDAYALGVMAGKKTAAQRQSEVQSGRKRQTDMKGQLHFAGDRGKLTERQKVSLQTCEVVAKALGIDVYVFESQKGENGKRVGDNGWYDPKDGSIHIDLYAGQNGEGVMVFTLAHELVHFIKDWSPAKFRKLAGFLAEQYGKKGVSIRDFVLEKQAKAKEDGRKLSFDQAYEEWVADSMETMLTDGTVVEKLSQLQATDKGLVQKIREFIKGFVERLKNAYKGISAQTKEGQIVSEMVDATQQLQDLFADALIDAGNTYSIAEKNTTDDGGVNEVMYSIRQTRKMSLKDQLSAYYKRKFRQSDSFYFGMTPTVLAESGLDLEPLAFNQDDFKKSTKDKHKIPRRVLNKLAENLGKPIFSFSAGKQVAVAIDDIDGDGKPVVVAIHGGHVMDRAPINLIKSLYGVESIKTWVGQQINGGGKFRVYDIEKANAMLQTQGYLAAVGTQSDGSWDIITKISDAVKGESDVKQSARVNDGLSPRELLLNTVEGMVANSDEYRVLQKYRRKIQELNETEKHLERLNEQLRQLYFAEGGRDYEMINKLEGQRAEALTKLNRYDSQLINLENTKPIRDIVNRMKQAAYDRGFRKAKDYYKQKADAREEKLKQHYQESRRNAVERHDKAQIRQQIRKDVERLASLLNKGNKQKNVKQELQVFAGAALRTAQGTFLNNYNEYDMIRNGLNATMNREQKQIFDRCRELLTELDKLRDEKSMEPGATNMHDKWDPEAELRRDDREEALKKELSKNMRILRDAGLFCTENELMEDSNAEQLLNELLTAYSALKDSELAHVRGVYSQVIYDQIDSVKKFLAGKAVKDMTMVELKELQKMYRMVLHTVTTSNELFAQKRKADVRKLGEEIITQLQDPGKAMTPEILDRLKKMGWANLKPETALELIGSDTLTEMMQGLYRGEDSYALDINHARKFAQEQAQKYGRKNWDMEKPMPFAGTKITLGQAMSLYAYTKRQQAQGHLEGDGFTSAANVRIKETLGKLPVKLKYIMNATKTHKVSKDMYAKVADLLTPQQKKYAEAMMEYLTKVMGAKGNEVSMQLYGIELFQEKTYFPIQTAAEYHDEALGATSGEVKLKNTGFTNKVQEGASNPIVLDDFERIWAGHVDKMSLYHGFVLPMEDFDRVYNYHLTEEREVTDAAGEVYKTETVDTNETVKVDIENKVGKAANAYIEQFMQQLNGGVRGDSTEKLFGSLVRNFKKAAVLGSLSVAIQQPTAFVRAMAYLDMRDVADWRNWLGKSGKPEGKIVEEMYKYAPVALMKKIGGFDPGLGRTSQDYIFDNKEGVVRKLENALGMLPEKMDEWTWIYIWVCSKRQIHRKHPVLRVGSKEFCEKAGELFSKIIRDTQVYDSVLVKTQVMRSKNLFLQMATSFLNEPSTSMDMYIRSAIQAKRGKIKGKQLASVYGSVVGSQILCAALAAFVYAARDDDEDETYLEKYLNAALSKSLENVLPWYSIPFVKDIVSIFEGYDVERSDMSIVTDIYQGWKKLQNDDATAWEKTEAFAGSILNLFGIPLKNVSRDIRGIYNTIDHWINPRTAGTKAGTRYAIKEGLTGKETSAAKQLENAVIEDDAAHILRVMGAYNTEEAALSAVRTAVENAYISGKITEERAAEYLQTYGGMEKEDALEKIVYFEFLKEHPDSELYESASIKWYTQYQNDGISLEIYTEYCELKKGLTKKAEIMRVIDSLDLTKRQKDALYYGTGYAESTIDEAPWH